MERETTKESHNNLKSKVQPRQHVILENVVITKFSDAEENLMTDMTRPTPQDVTLDAVAYLFPRGRHVHGIGVGYITTSQSN